MNAKARIHGLLKSVRGLNCIVEYWDGDRVSYGDGKLGFTLRIKDRAIVGKVLADLLVQLPESYVSGEIEIDGNLQDLLRLCYDVDPRSLDRSLLQRIALGFAAVLYKNSLVRAKKNVSHHYDLGNDFFRIWLDERMVYSCAYFKVADDDLDKAQRQKLQYLCTKLRLEPNHGLLDIGCGWGALALHAAESHGATVLGVTLSEEQHSACQNSIRQANLQDRVKVRLKDYRELGNETFDRVVSVGMMEHIGRSHLREYMEVVARCLRSGGRGVFQWISKNRQGNVTPWITKRIFPGMYLPTLGEVVSEMAAAGLHVVDAENLRPHYAMTLDAWIERFERSSERIGQMYDERFVRMWRMYLNAASIAFKCGSLNLWQVTFTQGLSDETPLTRQYMYREADYPAVP